MWRFIVLYGVLGWGLSTAVLFLLANRFVFGETVTWSSVPGACATFMLAGIAWGWWVWRFRERNEQKDRQRQQ